IRDARRRRASRARTQPPPAGRSSAAWRSARRRVWALRGRPEGPRRLQRRPRSHREGAASGQRARRGTTAVQPRQSTVPAASLGRGGGRLRGRLRRAIPARRTRRRSSGSVTPSHACTTSGVPWIRGLRELAGLAVDYEEELRAAGSAAAEINTRQGLDRVYRLWARVLAGRFDARNVREVQMFLLLVFALKEEGKLAGLWRRLADHPDATVLSEISILMDRIRTPAVCASLGEGRAGRCGEEPAGRGSREDPRQLPRQRRD